jgi:acid phosphatase (class A)
LRRAVWLAALLVAMLAVGYAVKRYPADPHFLNAPVPDFVALFDAPPSKISARTRQELDEMLAIQARRTPSDIQAARADRKTDVWQFAAALGLPPDEMRGLRELRSLAGQVEDDVRSYVRAAKKHFLRLRPYEVEPLLAPCIHNVRRDLSYPSGHAAYGYVMAYLLSEMVPERRRQLMARAQEFARQRVVCGVHFPSDIEAGRRGAEWLAQRLLQNEPYRAAAAPVARELRAALNLPATPLAQAGPAR